MNKIINEYQRQFTFFDFWLKKFLPKNKKAFILDAGCGQGNLLFYLKEKGYRNILGVDKDPTQIKIAKKITNKLIQKEINCFLTDNKQKFDLICALDLIEHLSEKESINFLRLIKKKLTKNGLLIIRTINGASPQAGSYFWGDLTHKNMFTPLLLKNLLQKTGFKKIILKEFPPVPHGFISLVRYFLWQIIRLGLIFWNLIETGIDNHIATRNMVIVAYQAQNSKHLKKHQ